MQLAACATVPIVSTADKLDRLYEEYFEAQLQLSPTSATYLGDERYNDQLENPASAAFESENTAIEKRFLQRARSVGDQAVTSAQQVSYDIFVSDRERTLQSLQYPSRYLAINQLDSMAATFAQLGSGSGPQPFRDARDYQRFLKRGEGFVRWVDAAIGSLREGVRLGVTQPRVVMAKVVPQLREIGVVNPENSIFWQPLRDMPVTIPAAERSRLTVEYRKAIGEQILPAYRRLADFIQNEYLPQARTTVGWSALPNGVEWYRDRIRSQTTTTLSAEEIHQLGLREVARIRAEMENVRQTTGFSGNLKAFFVYLQTDPRFYYNSAAELLAGYQDLKKRIDGLLPAEFADFPRSDYEIREVEPFRAASAAGGSYQQPSADGKRPGIFYVNTFNLKAQPKFGMETLSLHEAAPGHHFQIAIQQELTDLPRFRRFGGYVAYAEGWALYCESIGKELGLFTDPYQWYGRLSDEMLRAMRLVVDTGLHAKGWTREQAIAYMQANSSMADSDVEAEVERYIVWPGQALGYKVGQLRITALRARAEAALGKRFDIKAFHSQVLRDGAVPLDVLEAKIDRWIAAQQR